MNRERHSSIENMADAMQEKLAKNAVKKGWPTNTKGKRGWLSDVCPTEFLVEKLREEVGELLDATDSVIQCNRRLSPSASKLRDLKFEAADVANLAMMIADNLGAYDE